MPGPEVDLEGPRSALRDALLAGQLAGLALLVVLGLACALTGGFFLFPLQVIASFALGPAALGHVTAASLVAGLAINQLGPSLFWSILFGGIVGAVRGYLVPGQALLFGLAYGAVAEVIDVYLFMPRLQQALHGRNLWAESIPEAWDWLAHLAYGASLALFYVVLWHRESARSTARGR